MVRNTAKKKDLDKSGAAVHGLSQIMRAPVRELDELLDDLLKLGCEVFEFDVGVLSRIDGDRYEVVASRAPSETGLQSGTTLDLAETFCAQTVEDDLPTVITSGAGKPADHPARVKHGFEAYLGTTVRVDGDLFGTLSFSGFEKKKRTFSSVEVDILQLMAGWLGTELSRRSAEDRLGAASRNLEEARQEMKRLATHDALTGVLNRREVLRRLSDERNRAAREHKHFGVFVMDVDRLRRVNDAIGFAGGDQVLVEVVARVASCLRNYDHIGRLGGKQFLGVLPGCSLAEAAEIAERARVALAETPIRHDDGEFDVTASFGVSCADAADLTEDELLSTADKALFLAKSRGKNSVRGAMPRSDNVEMII
jgi:diguanylate cyclase (GGDEF)-like protein